MSVFASVKTKEKSKLELNTLALVRVVSAVVDGVVDFGERNAGSEVVACELRRVVTRTHCKLTDSLYF